VRSKFRAISISVMDQFITIRFTNLTQTAISINRDDRKVENIKFQDGEHHDPHR
jgi:hypothetical protein